MRRSEIYSFAGALPRYPNVLGKERFFNAAVLIPLLEQHGELHFIFQKRASHIRQGGEVSFPGGEHDPGQEERCQETALRETEEELGLHRERISVLGRLDTLVSPRGITVESFPAQVHIRSLEELAPDPQEVERLFTLPVSWFEANDPEIYWLDLEIQPYLTDAKGTTVSMLPVQELGLPQYYAGTWKGLQHRVLIYHSPEEIVWGLTADLIQEVISRLQLARRAR